MTTKGRRSAHVTPLQVIKYFGRKVKTTFLVFIALITMALTVAAPAQAGPVDWIMGEGENFILSTFCTEPGTGYSSKPVGITLPNSGDIKNPDHVPALNAAEVMGNAVHYTSWYGWKNNESVQGDGKDTGSGAVAAVGGKDNNGGLSEWKMDEAQYPYFELQGSCLEGETVFNTMVGNALLQGNYMLVYATSFLLDLNTGGTDGVLGTTLSSVTTAITSVILEEVVWPFSIPLIMIGAVVLGYFGLVKKQFTLVWSGVAKAVLAMLIIAFLTANPTILVTAGTSVQAVAGKVTTQIVTGGLEKVDPIAKDMCVTGVIDGDKTQASNRQTTCILWYAFYYKPWVVGQFGAYEGNYILNGGIPANATKDSVGDALTGGDPAKQILTGGYSSNNDLAHVYARAMVDDGTAATNMKMRTMYNVTAIQLADDNANSAFAGEISSTRIAYAAAAGVAALCALLLVGSIMIPLMALTFSLFFMGIFVALKMLISLVASHTFRPQTEALMTIVGIFIQMLMLNLYAGIALVIIVTIAANTLNTLVNMGLCIAICFAGIVYRKQILKAFDIGTYFGMATETDVYGNMGVNKMTHMATHAAYAMKNGGKNAVQGGGTATKAMTSRNLPVPTEGGGAGVRPRKNVGAKPSTSDRPQETATKESRNDSTTPAPRNRRAGVVKSVKENGVRATAAAGVASAKETAKVAKEQRREDRQYGLELRKAGYRGTVPLSTRGTAAVAGFAVTAVKGKNAGDATVGRMVAKGGAKQVQRNETAVAKVEAIRKERDERLEQRAEEGRAKRDAFHAPRVEAEKKLSSNESAAFERIKKEKEVKESARLADEKLKEKVVAQEERRKREAEIKKEVKAGKTTSAPAPKSRPTALPPLSRRNERPERTTNSPTPRSK